MKTPPQRWHLYVVDLKPRVGAKSGKQRPCLAIQPDEFGNAGLESTVVLPLTTRVVTGNAFPLRVRLQKGRGGINRESDILVDQMLAWDSSLFRRELGTLAEALQDEVKAALREFLDL